MRHRAIDRNDGQSDAHTPIPTPPTTARLSVVKPRRSGMASCPPPRRWRPPTTWRAGLLGRGTIARDRADRRHVAVHGIPRRYRPCDCAADDGPRLPRPSAADVGRHSLPTCWRWLSSSRRRATWRTGSAAKRVFASCDRHLHGRVYRVRACAKPSGGHRRPASFRALAAR